MTIAEIESTLQTLAKRHPNLDEALLTTLLTASGWEEKAVSEALAVFKVSKSRILASVNDSTGSAQETLKNNGSVTVSTPVVNQSAVVPVALPAQDQVPAPIPEIVYYTGEGEEEKIVPVMVETPPERKKEEIKKPKVEELVIPKAEDKKVVLQVADISLTLPKNDTPKVEVANKQNTQPVPVSKEPESLVTEKTIIRPVTQPVEIPENLPLKPFETTPHIWPFSKYKEVFHGTEKTQQKEPQSIQVPPPVVAGDPHVEQSSQEEHHHAHVEMKRSELDGEDEGLIFLTGVALLVILLLLAYMYSNGRL